MATLRFVSTWFIFVDRYQVTGTVTAWTFGRTTEQKHKQETTVIKMQNGERRGPIHNMMNWNDNPLLKSILCYIQGVLNLKRFLGFTFKECFKMQNNRRRVPEDTISVTLTKGGASWC